MIAQLRDETERTKIGAMRLLRGAKDRPAGLSASIISSWLRGAVKSARQDHFNYVLERWSVLPTDRRRPLTAAMVAELNAELIRTGMGAVTLLKKAPGLPAGLTWQVIQQWVSSDVNTVSDTQWDYAMARLRELPAAAPPSSHYAARIERHDINPSDLAELRHHRERTGIGGAVLLRTARDKPEGLTPAMVSGWLSGVIATARPEHVAYVLARYRAWP